MDMIFVIQRFTVDVCVVRVNNFSNMEIAFLGIFLIGVVIFLYVILFTPKNKGLL